MGYQVTMDPMLLLAQGLNGLQLGMMLFLMAAGLTLVFGIMQLINLAHGSMYMLGAYLAATFQRLTGSFLGGVLLALPVTLAIGMVIEMLVLRPLYQREHLDQVLATFGLILFCNELVRIIWGPQAYFMPLPAGLEGQVMILPGLPYSTYRLAIVGVGGMLALGLYGLIQHTRVGMWIRAGASNRTMINALGVNITLLYTLVFGLGTLLAGLAGMLAGPLLAVQVGMGESILILTFVVIIIGGIGSIRGAFLASLLVGVIDTFGRVLLPPALASMSIYGLMAVVLCWRPHGLFPVQNVRP